MGVRLIHGDCLVEMAKMPDSSVDAIVTDPPYELGFMGKSWDSTGIAFSPDTWRACLRVLKPGGHMLCFGGSRTFHRIAVAIEDAGFELRDTVMWVYGSGFPKSHDVSKAVDKEAGAEREVIGSYKVPNIKGDAYGTMNEKQGGSYENITQFITTPATPDAAKWQGWGTALKPAFEPIILARKPLEGTVAGNVQKWGTGAINVDGCRVDWDALSLCNDTKRRKTARVNIKGGSFHAGGGKQGEYFGEIESPPGRWPANFIHDGSEEVLELMPETKSGDLNKVNTSIWGNAGAREGIGHTGDSGSAARFFMKCEWDGGLDTDSAARFFYCAKASKRDRDEGCEGLEIHELGAHGDFAGTAEHGPKHDVQARNNHPTVKPTSLMRYLCRLITPPNGIVLDPFMGSGSTGKAAVLEGFGFIGIEREAEYMEIARARINHAGAGDVADQVIPGRCEDMRLPLWE